MQNILLLALPSLLVACGPEPPANLVALFVPDTVVVTTAQPATLTLRLQNTGRGTAVLPAGTRAGDFLQVTPETDPKSKEPPVPLKPSAPPGKDPLPTRWAYGYQQTVRCDLSPAFADLSKTGSYRVSWTHPSFPSPATATLQVVEPGARIRTNFGEIVVAFHPEDAPKTVLNFIALTKKKFYDGLVFHRIIPGFMMQGGCPNGDGSGDAGYKIKAEFNARRHVAGTLSMARTDDPDSAGSQFFICFAPAPHLDRQYTAFAQVVRGLDVLKKIEGVGTAPLGRPTEKVAMESVTLLDALPESK